MDLVIATPRSRVELDRDLLGGCIPVKLVPKTSREGAGNLGREFTPKRREFTPRISTQNYATVGNGRENDLEHPAFSMCKNSQLDDAHTD